jgi:hypothetical protein
MAIFFLQNANYTYWNEFTVKFYGVQFVGWMTWIPLMCNWKQLILNGISKNELM